MYKVDRNNGGHITTSGKIAWPARHYWWEVVGYDVETDSITHSTTFEAEEAAQAAYDEIKSQEGAMVMTEDSRPDLEYVIADGVEYVLHAHDEQTVYYEEAEGHAALSLSLELRYLTPTPTVGGNMKLKRLDPPAKRSQKLVSLYDQLITPEMVRMTRAHPGETFALVDDTERLMTFDKNQVGRIRAKAPRPLCFVSREAPGTHTIGRA